MPENYGSFPDDLWCSFDINLIFLRAYNALFQTIVRK